MAAFACERVMVHSKVSSINYIFFAPRARISESQVIERASIAVTSSGYHKQWFSLGVGGIGAGSPMIVAPSRC